MDPVIHETASVEPGAILGQGTRVWHHTQIRTNAVIGTNCVLAKNVFIDFEVKIGSRCKFQNNVNVFNGVTIDDDVFVGPSATFTNDLVPRAFASDWSVTPTHVHRGSSIGANATIVCGIELGEYSMIGAGSVVTKNVAAHSLVVGNPARPIGWVCKCGQLVSRSPERPSLLQCRQCKGDAE